MIRDLAIVIVEDEESALNRLKRELYKIDNLQLEILGEFETSRSTIKWLKTNLAPDLIFMDIQLADGLSFEIFDQVMVPCPVIFTTAYDEYAIKAFRVNSLDYLLKPIDSQSLKNSIDKYFENEASIVQKEQMEQLQSIIHKLKKQEYRSSYLVYFKQKMLLVNVSQIAYFFIKHRQVHIMTNDSKQYPLDHSLEEIEAQVDPSIFYRANRQFLVAKSAINEIEPYFTGRLILHVSPQFSDLVTVSKEKVSDFKQWADN